MFLTGNGWVPLKVIPSLMVLAPQLVFLWQSLDELGLGELLPLWLRYTSRAKERKHQSMADTVCFGDRNSKHGFLKHWSRLCLERFDPVGPINILSPSVVPKFPFSRLNQDNNRHKGVHPYKVSSHSSE